MARIKPEDVFTPRADPVYTQMYIPRPDLEESLNSALRIPKHIVIHGESGSGKSWLYKNVFLKNSVYYEVVNLGRAKALGSIDAVICNTVGRLQEFHPTGFSETKQGEISTGFATGNLSHTKNFELTSRDNFSKCLALVRAKAKNQTACLVFENLEHILDDERLVAELGGLLLLVDDDQYSQHGIKLVLVGTSDEIRSYITRATKSNTITNRLSEIPEVARLTDQQAKLLVERGFFELLKLDVPISERLDKTRLTSLILHFSDRIPQYLQEFCLHLAICSEKYDDTVDWDIFLNALRNWIRSSLVSELAVVEFNLNSKSTKIGRKNQVIYAISESLKGDFTARDIEEIVRSEFSAACFNKTLNVGQLLSELASSEKPMIRKLPRSNTYRFVDPKIKIVARSKLFKAKGSETLEIRPFDGAVTRLSR